MDALSIAKLGSFLVATAGLAYLSRASLVVPRSHGFYRFFAWEAILALAALNIDLWFRDPLSWHQMISWQLLVISAALVTAGVFLLRRKGAPDDRRGDEPLVAFEKTTTLVSTGVYHYIRHPLYSSLLFLTWGIFFKAPSWLGGLPAVAATLFLVATARVEEAENIRFFGQEYREYMRHTRMFIPYLF
ncbi:MAG TPA: isoprenylcysteine carboxylmethyltransferase family protein [Anaerolineae bacterium]|nr:isoprenylcysteine carboxylmethyltransferase family protein [Anaerolineae bacterium]